MKKIYFLLLLVSLASFTAHSQLIINEILYDPSNAALDGDANGDGVYSQTEDEFIEFYNTSSTPLDISGYMIYDSVISTGLKTLRHTFISGTVIPANEFLVIFGGGTASGNFGSAIVVVDSGTAGLSMQNSDEVVLVEDANGVQVLSFDTDALSDNPNESYTRDPDITGTAFVQHAGVTAAAGRLFSPGRYLDGTSLSIQESKIEDLEIFPNPANSILTIETSLLGNKQIELIDISGRMVFSTSLSGNKIDVSSYDKGVYLLKVIIEGKTTITKLIVE